MNYDYVYITKLLKLLTSNLIPSILAIDLSIADDTVLESKTNLEFVLPWICL